MAIKAETIAQFGGFGNLIPKSENEHFRSFGFARSANGMSASRKTAILTQGNPTLFTQSDYSALDKILAFADGYGRPYSSGGGAQSMMFALTERGEIWQSLVGVVTPELVYDYHRNGSHFSAGGIGGLIVDQKNRLLAVGQRYLGVFDPSVSETGITFTATNGSNALVATSGSFTAGMVDKLIRVFMPSGGIHYYRLNNYTDATHMSIYSTFTGTTGSYSCYVLMSWTERFKDFGGNITSTTEGSDIIFPTETYEDTVLIGRRNKIVTLNTVTDTATTDASPSFTLPDGFDILAIHKGANGVLIASNFQRKGMLVLWDNFSDRSIAPWIPLNDRLVSCCKYNGGWLVITTREIFYTNGYSLTPLINSFLDSKTFVFQASLFPQSSVVIENDLYISLGVSYNGKRRCGIHKIDLETKLAEYVPRHDMEAYNERTTCFFYGAGNGTGRVYVGSYASWDYITVDSVQAVSCLVTNPVGRGDNWKHAEALKVDLGISQTYYSPTAQFSFTISLKVAPLRKQMQNYGQLKVAMTEYNKITVNETINGYQAKVGDLVEFYGGVNAGLCRNILSKTGEGTATAVWTLDRALPYLDTNTSNLFFTTPFQLVKVKTYTNISEMPEVWFDIKNKIKAKKFMLRIDIEDATAPIELKPMLFVYDDLGVL